MILLIKLRVIVAAVQKISVIYNKPIDRMMDKMNSIPIKYDVYHTFV